MRHIRRAELWRSPVSVDRRSGTFEAARRRKSGALSYHTRAAPDWPYDVTSLSQLPTVLDELDGLIIGGGLLIRFDKDIAPDYGSPTEALHHPTGYWLTPALLALQRGCPVAWNAPGALGDVPGWAEPLMHVAFGSSRYVAVRDDASRTALARFAGETKIAVMPDTGFAIADLVNKTDQSNAFADLCEHLGVRRPYFVVHATTGLKPFCDLMRNYPERFKDFQIIALATGPALGDSVAHIRADLPDVISLPTWSNPLLIAEIIKHAIAVVGKGLHLSITALAFGVPVFRPEHAFAGKYALLTKFSRVFAFPDNEQIEPFWFLERIGQLGLEPGVIEANIALKHHWDTIASVVDAEKEQSTPKEVSRLWQALPILLETDSNLANSLSALNREMAEQRASITERDNKIASLEPALADRSRELDEKQAVIVGLKRDVCSLTERLTELEVTRNSRRASRLRRLIKWPTFRTATMRLRRIDAAFRARRLIKRSGLFDKTCYKENYPDVAAAGADPIRHYLAEGAREGRDPSPSFSTWKYLWLHPDVAAAGINPLLHYILARENGDAKIDLDAVRPGQPVTLRSSTVGKLVSSFCDRSNEERAVVLGIGVSVWHQSAPKI
jgi:lipopolysaccharide transport system ATP-binding protein